MLESLFNKLYLKKTLQRKCFPVSKAKFLRTLFFKEHLRWLLLKFYLFLKISVEIKLDYQ